jgi:prevent-host-death family protein
MKRIPAQTAREHFTELCKLAHAEPVTITRAGSDELVVLSAAEYRRLLGERRPPGSDFIHSVMD